MSLLGDTSEWDDLFEQKLIPTILALVLAAWERLPVLAENEREDKVTDKLYAAMLNAKDRQRHPFLIRPQDAEFNSGTETIIGWKDIVFYPSHDEEIYFCLEAKRLNAVVSGKPASLASEYVSEGMQRFVDRKYSPHVRHGGMLGYVLDGDIARAITNVANCIRLHETELRMDSPGELRPSTIRPHDENAKESHHWRDQELAAFRLHHLFVS
jgi:hypothetical protein